MKSFNLKSLSFFIALLFSSSLLFTSCEDDITDEPDFPDTLTEVLADDFELTMMAEAIELTSLTSQLNNAIDGVTLFAPTNTAFSTFLSNAGYYSLNEVPTEDLKKILLYHTINGNVGSFALEDGYLNTLAQADVDGAPFLSLRVDPTNNTLNNTAEITSFDIDGIGNTIHVIDAVNTIPDVVDAADNDGRLARLVVELATAGLAGDLQTDGPFTIFAPNDDAIQWGTSMGIVDVSQILLDHVIAGNFRSEDLTHDMLIQTEGMDNINDYRLRITQLGEETEIKIVEADNTNVAIATVLAIDIQANNGVLHIIDNVIVFPQ